MINLLSPKIKEERMYGRRNLSLLGYGVILLTTSIVIMIVMAGSLQFVGPNEDKLKEDIENFNIEIAALESSVQSIEEVASRLDTAKKINDLSVEFSNLIPEIGSVLPSGVVLNALSLTGGVTDPLQLDVDLQTAGLAPVLIRNLVESELFEAADISAISPKGTTDDEDVEYNFTASVTASFTGTAEAIRKAAAAEAAAAEAAAAALEEQAAQ